MTVNTTKITAGPYVGNGVADTVSFGFKIFDQEELTVYETDNTSVVTELMLGTDYTVQDLTDTGGTITRIAGPIPTGFTWFIRSNFIETQVTSFGSQGAFYPEIHEDAFDKLTMLIQQATDLNGRSPTMLQSYSGELPILLNDPVDNYYLKWSADLTTIENVDAEGVMDQKDDVTLNAANQWAKNYTDQSVFDSGSVTPVTVNAGDEQLSGHVIFPTGTMYSAVVGDSIAVIATALRDGVNNIIYETSESVTGVITDIDFGAGTATIGGASVTLTAMNTIKDNTSDIATNTSDIATNTSDIATNTSDIATNTSDIATLNGQVFNGSYGLVWNSEVDTYTRVGSSNTTQIQEQMKRCVLNSDGTVNYYLHPNDSTLKADGVTPSVLDGTDGNVMVQIPKFYVKYTTLSTSKKVEISATPSTGFTLHKAFIKAGVEVDYRYYRAYTGYDNAGTLVSVSGVTPTKNQTISSLRTKANNNGVGWHLTDWHLLQAVRLLLWVEIGTFDSQSVLGNGNDNGTDYGITTGQSNSIGNVSSGVINNNIWMSYRGIENFYADAWEMTDGINISEREVFINDNYVTFESDVFTGDYVSTGVVMPVASSSYIKDVVISDNGFIPTVAGGSSSTYITDGLWTETGARIYIHGGAADAGLLCGAWCSTASRAASLAYVSIGAAVSF